MSRDSSATYLHMHSSRLADLFEDFCRPPSSSNSTTPYSSNPASASNNNANGGGGSGAANPNATNNNASATATGSDPGTAQLPGHFLPFEEIHLPPHLMPLNPEDEDDVVPDMHAAFGITRALGQNGVGGGAGEVAGVGGAGGIGAGLHREPVWRDLGLERLVDSGPGVGDNGARTGTAAGVRRGDGKRAGRAAMMR